MDAIQAAQVQQKEQEEKAALIRRYAPELENGGLDQTDISVAMGRLTLEKTTLEKQLNAMVEKLIAVSKERDGLKAENDQLKAQLKIVKDE